MRRSGIKIMAKLSIVISIELHEKINLNLVSGSTNSCAVSTVSPWDNRKPANKPVINETIPIINVS